MYGGNCQNVDLSIVVRTRPSRTLTVPKAQKAFYLHKADRVQKKKDLPVKVQKIISSTIAFKNRGQRLRDSSNTKHKVKEEYSAV